MDNAITVIGLGLMGQALARSLAAAGFDTTVWNRTERPGVVGEAVRIAPSVSAAISASPTTLICVADNSAVEAVLTGAHGSVDLVGRDIINLTTGSPREADHLARLVSEAGGRYLTGIIAAYPNGIGKAETQLILGGDESIWHRNDRALLALGGASWWSGTSVRQPAALDIALLNVYYATLASFLTSARYILDSDIPAENLMRVVNRVLTGLPAMATYALSEVESKQFDTDQATLDVHLAAMEQCVASMGAHANLLLPVIEFFRRAQIGGAGAKSFAAFTEHIA